MQRNDERGFSYLELLLALGNFAIGFAALLSLNAVVGDRNLLAREITTATLIGQNQLEALKLQGYSSLIDDGSVDGSAGPFDATGQASATGRYTVSWDIQDDVPTAGLKRVLLTVSWQESNGAQKSLVLDTVVGNVSI